MEAEYHRCGCGAETTWKEQRDGVRAKDSKPRQPSRRRQRDDKQRTSDMKGGGRHKEEQTLLTGLGDEGHRWGPSHRGILEGGKKV